MFSDPDDFTPRLMRRIAAYDSRGRERDAIRWYGAERLRGRPLVSLATLRAGLASILIAAAIVGFCAVRW